VCDVDVHRTKTSDAGSSAASGMMQHEFLFVLPDGRGFRIVATSLQHARAQCRKAGKECGIRDYNIPRRTQVLEVKRRLPCEAD
jgi:hypothetical protein